MPAPEALPWASFRTRSSESARWLQRPQVPKTAAALHRLQAQHHLETALLYGPETHSALAAAPNARTYPDVPGTDFGRSSVGSEVSKLQRALVWTGFLSRSEAKAEPGQFADKTEAAVKRLQQQYSLMASGFYGGSTRYVLQRLIQAQKTRGKVVNLVQPANTPPGKYPYGLYAYSVPVTGVKPSPRMSAEGSAGDCFFLSALGAIAQVAPHLVEERVKDNKNGTWTFTFQRFNEITQQYDPDPVTVDANLYAYNDFPTTKSPHDLWPVFARDPAALRGNDSTVMSNLLFLLFEKAFAQFEAGAYGKIDGGFSANAFESLLGIRGRRTALGNADEVWSQLETGLQSKTPMVLDTRDGADDDAEMNAAHLITDHGYIVLQTALRHGE